MCAVKTSLKRVKYRKRAIGLAVIAGLVLVGALFSAWFSGPAYRGKSAAQWFALHRSASTAEQEDAKDAFQAMGEQGVPYLVSVLTRSDRGSLASRYGKLWSRLPQPFRTLLPDPPEETDQRIASGLLWTIRPSARVLLPRLEPWLSDPNHRHYTLALSLLGTIGEGGSNGVPFLVEALRSENARHRVFAVQSLRVLGAEARDAVPALIEALEDQSTRERAIVALGNIGPDAEAAVPYLERLLASNHRLPAAAALHSIVPETGGLRILIDALADPKSRLSAIHWLGEIGPSASPALDAMTAALRIESGRNLAGGPQSITIADAVRKISPHNRAVISILTEKLQETDRSYSQPSNAGIVTTTRYGVAVSTDLDRLNIASRLVWFEPSEPHGLQVLTETLRSAPDPGTRSFAAYALRQAGPGARAAIPALKSALRDSDETVRRSAVSALRKVDTPHAE